MNAVRKGNLLPTLWKKALQYLPLVLIILIIEGSVRKWSIYLLIIYIIARTYQVYLTIDKSGAIDQLGQALWGKKK